MAEGDLFQSASHERKHLGFQLFSILLPHLRSATRKTFCRYSVCRCMILYRVLVKVQRMHFASALPALPQMIHCRRSQAAHQNVSGLL